MTERSKWIVLVVEDDPDVLKLITRVLEKSNYEVMTASNGQEGLVMANARPRPNLVISDVMMPDMDGVDMVRHLKEDPMTRTLPVIFLTARDTPANIIEGIQAGARHYLTKPFRVPDLIEKVQSVLRPHPDE